VSETASEESELLAREQTAEPPYRTALLVADLLQVDEKTVLRWSLEVDAGPSAWSRLRFPRERLFAWLERQESPAARRPPKPSAAS